MPYSIRLPDGALVQNIPDDLPPEEAKRRIVAAGLIKAPPPPETTILGQIKEGFKGLIPGAVGLVESAATGASALLPEQYEKTAREKIASVAGAAKAPFAAAPGYEETVGRKLGEAIGSTVPFLAAGPLGLAGRVGAVGLGVGAGAGEARTRAEKEGATAEQRSTATALGIIPGAMEVFAPFRILSRIPDAATAQGVQLVKRALVAGGEEAAQEAASGFAQNLIAKGVYKPEQELIEGLGEQAAYGGATGAIVQGLMDLALGRRARAAQPAPGTLPGEKPIERAERLAAEVAAAKAAQQPAPPPVPTTPPAPGEAPISPTVAETPAPEPPAIPEPKVRKMGEPIPLPDVLDSDTVKRIGFPRGKVHDALVGKSLTDPEIRTVLEEYLNRPTASTKTAEKINAFLARLPEPVAPAAPPVVETAPPAPPPVAEIPAPVAPPVAETPSVPSVPTEPETGGAGAPVVSEPGAGAAPEGVGAVEPTGVVRPVADVEQPVGGEGAAPVAVAPAAPAPAPAQIERELASLVNSGRITEEQAEEYRAELLGEAEEASPTAMGAAFQKQVDAIKAQMDALKRNKRRPAKKTPAGNKYDELEAQLQALMPKAEGNLADRIESLGLSSVIGKAPYPGAARGDDRVTIDIDSLKENLIRAKASPRMFEAILNYIGVDADGNFLPTTYSREEAAEMAGLGRATGAEVSRAADALGVTGDVRSRFFASQSELAVGAAKNASEEGTGATDLNPRRGVLYEPKKKGLPAVAPFLRGALTSEGTLDFSESRVPLESSKAKGDKKAVVGLAEMFVRASQFNRGKYKNDEVINALQAEVDRRIKIDRKKVNDAITRAYGKFTETEDVSDSQKALELQIEKGIKTGDLTPVGEIADLKARELAGLVSEGKAKIDAKLGTISLLQKEAAAPDQKVREKDEEVETEDKTRRLSDEDIESETRATTPAYPEVEDAEAKRIEDQIRGKSLIEAAEFVAGYFKVGDQKLIAQRVVDRLRRMEAAGFDFDLVLVEPGVKAPTSIAVGNAHGASRLQYIGGMPKVTVYLRSVDIGTSGINPRIMLHEFLHAATQAAIHLGSLRGSVGSSTAKFASELIDLQNAFIKHFNQRVNDSKAGKVTLTEMEEAILKRNVNAGLDADELLAWGLTNPKFQQYLETIPYKARSMWTGFVDSIRSFLGMAPRMDTALSELLHVSENILNADPYEEIALSKRIWGAQTAPGTLTPAITSQTEAAVQGVDVIGEKERQTLTQRIAQDLKGNPALKARVKLTDSLAALEDFFVNAYGGAVRTAKGRLNPMVLISRALDATRVSKAAQEQGGLGFDTGLIVATELKNAEGQNISYQGVIGRIAEAAKGRGETYEQFRTKVDTVLYGHREYNLREANKSLPADEQVDLLLDAEEIDRLEAAFQQDDFIKGVSSDLDTIRFNLLDTLVQAGRISKEQATDYKDAIGYIPFNRIGEYENAWANATRGANRGVAALRNIRKLEGSGERKTTSVTENFSALMDWATKEAMKNDAGLRALKDMVLMGAAFKRPTKPKTDSPGDMVTVFDNGKPVSFYVPDPAHVVAFSIADPQLSNVLKAFQRGSQVLRAGVTSLPPFAIKQVFDDIVRAYTYAGVKNNAALVKSVMLNFPKNWVNEIFKKKPKDIKALEGLGIVGTFDFSQQGNLKNILEEAGAKKETLGSSIMRVMEAGAKASDLAVRQAIYSQVMKETGDKAQAESAAREIINFSRRGSSRMMGQMISIIPFFNAYARGMDKLATAAAGNVVGQATGTARAMFYKRMSVLTTMGLAYALMMQDDEDYQNLPDHVRDTNWVLPHGKELGFTPVIPIPAELAFFFKAIPERIVRYYKLYGTQEEQSALDVVGNLTSRGIDVFSSPNITPQVLRPFLENIANYSFFLGRPLESQAQQALRPFERYGTGTSDAMKAVAKGLEDAANATGIEAFAVSPIKLENAIRGIFGTAAGLGLSIADMAVNPGRTDRPIHQQLGSQLTGLSAVAKDPIGSRNLDFIYDLEKRVEQVNGTVNRLMERKPEDVDQFIKDNIGLYSVRGAVQGVMDGIRTLNKAAMAVDQDKSMSPEERRKLIDELRIDQNKLAQQGMALRKMARDIQMGL